MRSAISAVLVLVLLLTTACTMYPEKKKPAWDSATSGEQYERLFWDSVKAKNWTDVEAHLGGTSVTVGPGLVRNKQQTMEHLRELDLASYSLGDVQTETSGADLIVTYTIIVHGTLNGKTFPETPLQMMSVWQQQKKGMVMTAHATMPISH